jgi:phosphopantothenoylcysteine decarboxylase/phosphopantothenate--cysteine ligase
MSPLDKAVPEPVHILLLMSGSIACAKASSLVSAWVKQGHQVQVACTPSVAEFIGHATLEGFSGRPVLGSAFTPGQVMDHIHLARWADVVVAAPATSNLINKFAAGLADDVVTSLWQASYGSGKPMFVVPAMNTHMWNYPATQASMETLRSWGIHLLPTAEGDLACGEFGAGRMLEPEAILAAISPHFPGRTLRPKHILITGGGTREPIDAVRYIGNHSSGRTASTIADALISRGHAVTYLGALSALRPNLPCQLETFSSYADLEKQLRRVLGEHHFDWVIHAAAVSDFSVAEIEQDGKTSVAAGKLSSSGKMSLHLKPNAKLLPRLRDWSANAAVQVIGFKLTATADHAARAKAVSNLFEKAGVDAVVHNDLNEMRDLNEIQPGKHRYTLHTSPTVARECANSTALNSAIEQLLEELP